MPDRELMRDDAGPWPQLTPELGLQFPVHAVRQEERHDGRFGNIRFAEVSFYERDPFLDLSDARRLAGNGDQFRIELDADAPGSIFLCGEDDDPSIARSQVVHDVVARDAGKLEHPIDDRLPGRDEKDVGSARRLPGTGRRNRTGEGCGEGGKDEQGDQKRGWAIAHQLSVSRK